MDLKKVVFLDRDGVINRHPGRGKYVTSLEEFAFFPGSLEAIARLTGAGYLLFVVSNQAGVEKGLYTMEILATITEHMLAGIRQAGGEIEKVLYCTHLEEKNCSCRKPKTGLLREAVSNLAVDRENSYFIGDTLLDIETGKNFGCRTILVFSGLEKRENRSQWEISPDYSAESLADAVEAILCGRIN